MLLYQDVFTLHKALLVYPFPVCLCSWLMFIIELSHCLDTVQFSVATWLVILWGLRFNMVVTQTVQHFQPELPLPFSATFATSTLK